MQGNAGLLRVVQHTLATESIGRPRVCTGARRCQLQPQLQPLAQLQAQLSPQRHWSPQQHPRLAGVALPVLTQPQPAAALRCPQLPLDSVDLDSWLLMFFLAFLVMALLAARLSTRPTRGQRRSYSRGRDFFFLVVSPASVAAVQPFGRQRQERALTRELQRDSGVAAQLAIELRHARGVVQS